MRIAQICYGANKTTGISRDDLISGDIFAKYNNISQLGIQGFPGTAFYLNGGYQIALGETGIYEIDLGGRGNIERINFVDNSAFAKYDANRGTLLIDIVYEG